MTDAGETDTRLLHIAAEDNVCVATAPLAAGETVAFRGDTITVAADIGRFHKLAVRPIAAGTKVLKYGAPLGSARRDIAPGEHVHLHNLKSDHTESQTRQGPAGGGA